MSEFYGMIHRYVFKVIFIMFLGVSYEKKILHCNKLKNNNIQEFRSHLHWVVKHQHFMIVTTYYNVFLKMCINAFMFAEDAHSEKELL